MHCNCDLTEKKGLASSVSVIHPIHSQPPALVTVPCIKMWTAGFLFDFFLQGALNINDRTIPQPPVLQLSVEKLSRDGAYLMDAGSVSVQWWGGWFLKVSPCSQRTLSEDSECVGNCWGVGLSWVHVVTAGYLSGHVSVDWEELWAELYQPGPWSSQLRLNPTEHGTSLLCCTPVVQCC